MLDALHARRPAQQGRSRAQAAPAPEPSSPSSRFIPSTPELQAHLQRYLPEHSTDLVGIASRWADFQRIAQTMLIAAGLAPECLLVRDATARLEARSRSNIRCRLRCRPRTDLPEGCHPIVFRLLGEPSLADLRSREEAVLSASGH